MICSTSTANALLRKVAGRNKTVVCSFNKMIEQFAVDPTVMSPPRELYVVTNDDITTTKLKAAFEEAAATKHVNTKIIFVNKGKKEFYQKKILSSRIQIALFVLPVLWVVKIPRLPKKLKIF